MELQEQFLYISQLIAKAKERAYQAVNRELVTLYWHIGEYVSEQVKAKAWGKSVVKELSDFIQQSEPNIKGFSSQNIWRMKQFYETYKDNQKLSTLCREISWSNYALSHSLSPTLVADYQTKLPNKALLQAKWNEILNSLNLDQENE